MQKKKLQLKKFLNNRFFFAIIIGAIMTSGGIGKKELSAKDIIARYIFELLCEASFKDF